MHEGMRQTMNFSEIITFGSAPGFEAIPTYEGSIGWLATSIGLLAALSLLPTMERVAASRTIEARQSWVLAGAASMAIGVCAMLYSAMFGMTMPIPAQLDIPGVVLAPLPGILTFVFMIHLVGVQAVRWWRLHLAAGLCSLGLSGMHYAVLLSLGLDATIVISTGTLFIPLLIGYAGTMAGLYAYFGLAGTRTNSLLRKLLGSVLITYSTIGNHFSAMGQTQFYTRQPLGDYIAVMHPDVLPVVVILVSVIVGMLWIGSMVDARLSSAILAMEESEERSRAVIDGMLDAHITADRNGLIQTMNPAAQRLFGYSLDEVLNKPVAILVAHQYQTANSTDAIRAVADNFDDSTSSAGQYENAGRHRDGSTFPVEVVTSGLKTSRGIYFSAIVRDLTAKRTAEAELRLLGAAVENAGEAVCITGADGAIVYVNRAWEKRLCQPRADMMGKQLYALQKNIVEDPDRENSFRKTSAADDIWGGVVTTELPDGRRLHEDLLITPLREPGGTVTHYVSSWRDISDKLEMEKQLLRGQKLEAVGQLAAGIAHEINTPIQFVSDNIRFLKDSFRDISTLLARLSELGNAASDGRILSADISAALDEADAGYLFDEIPRAVDQSLDGVDRVSKIVRAMKDFSHPATDRTPLDINRAIASTATVASNEWKYVAELQTDFDPELPTVPVMPGDFNQVILNMIVNAAHAISDVVGDGASGRGVITLSTRRVHDEAEIRISDTGCGMTAETAGRIFDPFFTTKAVGKGTGQGLAITHNVIVDKHGGTIKVESTPGTGTTFIIRLPLDIPMADAGSGTRAA
ncbi:MAG: Two-component system, cell cycle sensor histidine kinase and response regulator CckA [Pseudomonadota bacterium]|nr:Two-component system, cell cycle sensor histidine kinase and response regulator CckA [Pseudomonadota bacterium]